MLPCIVSTSALYTLTLMVTPMYVSSRLEFPRKAVGHKLNVVGFQVDID